MPARCHLGRAPAAARWPARPCWAAAPGRSRHRRPPPAKCPSVSRRAGGRSAQAAGRACRVDARPFEGRGVGPGGVVVARLEQDRAVGHGRVEPGGVAVALGDEGRVVPAAGDPVEDRGWRRPRCAAGPEARRRLPPRRSEPPRDRPRPERVDGRRGSQARGTARRGRRARWPVPGGRGRRRRARRWSSLDGHGRRPRPGRVPVSTVPPSSTVTVLFVSTVHPLSALPPGAGKIRRQSSLSQGIPLQEAWKCDEIPCEGPGVRTRSEPTRGGPGGADVRELHRREVGAGEVGQDRQGHRPGHGSRRTPRWRRVTRPTSTPRSQRPGRRSTSGRGRPWRAQRHAVEAGRPDRRARRRAGPAGGRATSASRSPPFPRRSSSSSTTCGSSRPAPGSSRDGRRASTSRATRPSSGATRSASSPRSRRGTTRSSWRPGRSVRPWRRATPSC